MWCGVDSQNVMTAPKGTVNFVFQKPQCFPRRSREETLRKRLRALITCNSGQFNISRVTVICFLFHVIVFAMLPVHDIWR